MTTSEIVEAVYVHVPFCRRLCGYCDFYSIVPAPAIIPVWTDALLAELELYRQRIRLEIRTLYIGGGTPTTLPIDRLERLLRTLRSLPSADPNPEFTVEANPATISEETAATLATNGVNRVSIGAQSFNPAELAVLERIHGPDEIAETVGHCRRSGIARLNLDLIFAIPGQTLASWRNNLDAAVSLNPDHISCYSLTYEPGTKLHESVRTGRIRPVDHDLDADMYELAIDFLAVAGFEQYEISNFARPGCRCRHNLTYWRNEPYLGLGPAAAGYLDHLRYKNVEDVDLYISHIRDRRLPRQEEESRNRLGQMRDTALLALRTMDGIDRREFVKRFGSDPKEVFDDAIKNNVKCGLIDVSDNYIQLTSAGIRVADRVIADFL